MLNNRQTNNIQTKQRIFRLLRLVPVGRVATYGQLAKTAGTSARAVGQIIHQNPDPAIYPCHRVVFANGKLSKAYAFGGASAQWEKLKSEGVMFAGNRVDMKSSLVSSLDGVYVHT